jgi:hypothetical protein
MRAVGRRAKPSVPVLALEVDFVKKNEEEGEDDEEGALKVLGG